MTPANLEGKTEFRLSSWSFWAGMGLVMAYAVSLVLAFRGSAQGRPIAIEIAAAAAFFLAALFFLFLCVAQLHLFLQKITRKAYPISAIEAAFFSFIPIYNFYWLIKWPSEVINFVNAVGKEKKRKNWAPGLWMILSNAGAAFTLFASGLFFSFCVVGWLMEKTRRAVREADLPLTQYTHTPSQNLLKTVLIIWAAMVVFFAAAYILVMVTLVSIEAARGKGPTPAAAEPIPSEERTLEPYYEELGVEEEPAAH